MRRLLLVLIVTFTAVLGSLAGGKVGLILGGQIGAFLTQLNCALQVISCNSDTIHGLRQYGELVGGIAGATVLVIVGFPLGGLLSVTFIGLLEGEIVMSPLILVTMQIVNILYDAVRYAIAYGVTLGIVSRGVVWIVDVGSAFLINGDLDKAIFLPATGLMSGFMVGAEIGAIGAAISGGLAVLLQPHFLNLFIPEPKAVSVRAIFTWGLPRAAAVIGVLTWLALMALLHLISGWFWIVITVIALIGLLFYVFSFNSDAQPSINDGKSETTTGHRPLWR